MIERLNREVAVRIPEITALKRDSESEDHKIIALEQEAAA